MPWRIRLSAIQWLILSAAVLVIAIMLGTGYFAMQYRERALEVAERELNNSALLLSRHFDQQLLDLQHVQEDVVTGLRADGVHTADDFESKMSTLSAHEMLRTKLSVLPHVGALNLWSAKGWLINSSEMWPVPDRTIVDRRYFQAVHVGKADARRDRRAGREQGDQGLDDGLRAKDHRPRRARSSVLPSAALSLPISRTSSLRWRSTTTPRFRWSTATAPSSPAIPRTTR